MANHVHLLITPRIPVHKLMHSLKRFTAREGNRIFGAHQTGVRFVRNETELGRIALYIEMNPVRAGLVATPEAFLWSSAGPIDNWSAG